MLILRCGLEVAVPDVVVCVTLVRCLAALEGTIVCCRWPGRFGDSHGNEGGDPVPLLA